MTAYNPATGQFSEFDPTKPMFNADLQQWMADRLSAAIPAGSGKLLGAGTAGGSVPVSLSTAFTLSGNTLGLGTVTLGLLAQGGATSGQSLVWNGSAWGPGTISGGGTAYTGAAPIAVNGATISLGQSGATTGQVLAWSGTAWVPTTPASGGSTPLSGVTIDGNTIPGSTGTPYQMATADRVVAVNKTTGAATKVMLPTSPTLWVDYTIIDAKGDAATNSITVAAPNSGTINGAATLVIQNARGVLSVRCIASNTWSIV